MRWIHSTERSLAATLLIAVALLISRPLAAEEISFEDNWGGAGFNLVSQDASGVEVVFSITEMNLAEVIIDGQPMVQVQIPGVILPNDPGAPNLPGSGRYIALPQGADAVLEIADFRTEIFRGVDVAPAAPIPLETEDKPAVYIKDPAIYERNAYYPENPVQISDPVKIRGVDAVILGITPFQYNPVTRELVVYRDLRVKIRFQGGNGHFGEDRLRNRWWEPILKQHILNYQSLPEVDFNRLPRTDEEDVEYLIIVPDDPVFIAWADSIKQWRTRQGIITGITTLTEIGGNDASLIQSYLVNAYYTWTIPPVAVLLLSDLQNTGDTYGIDAPVWNNYCYADNIYADMDANGLPDFAISRIAAQNEEQLSTIIGKMLDYERTPPVDPGFYDQPLLAGGWQTERWFILCTEVIYGYLNQVLGKQPVREYAIYSGTPGTVWSTNQNTWMIVNYFGPSGLSYIPENPSYLTDWTGNATGINEAINRGAFIVQHRDHGYEQGWGEPSYSNGSLSGLANDMLPFVFSTNCLTGKYSYSGVSFAEAFHRMEGGCLGIIAASEVSYSFVNDTYQWGVYDALWPDFDPGYGADLTGSANLRTGFANASGKYYLSVSGWPSNPNNKIHTYQLFHHFGDAFITLFSEVPQELAVSHAPVLFPSASSFTVTADSGAIIALTVNDQIIGVAESDGTPSVIPIEPQIPGNTMIVTVTLQNHFRYEGEVDVVTEEPNYVVFYGLRINDSAGNGNELLDLGEDVLLTMAVENLGTQTAENIAVTIRTDDPYVTILDSTETYAQIPSGGRSFAQDAFEIIAAGDIPDEHVVDFTLVAGDGGSTWESPFSITACAPIVQFDELTVDDAASGNGDGVLAPGETADFIVEIGNLGSGDAGELTVTLACDEPLITITDDQEDLNELTSGSTSEVTFTGIVADQEISNGDTVAFFLQIEGVSGYGVTDSFLVVVGDYRFNPAGPDNYGYYAYDMYDGEYAPDFDWVEIAPAAGGPGLDLGLGNDTLVVVDLPFPFRFYGADYTQVTVGSHGWVEFGAAETFFPYNMPIPHVVPPDNFVAPLWDDLMPASGGQVAVYENIADDTFIIEWYQCSHAADPTAEETFQVVLFDPQVYPTLTGDGEIVVNYQTVSHRLDYCTVGIENADATDGIQYLFNDDYDPKAMPLEDGFAVKFTTAEPITAAGAASSGSSPKEFSLAQNYPNPFNPITVIRFDLLEAARVTLDVFDINGRRVGVELDQNRRYAPGAHEITFDASGLASGIYIYRLTAGEFTASGKMVLMK